MYQNTQPTQSAFAGLLKSPAVLLAGVFLGFAMLVGVLAIGSYISAANYGAQAENELQANYDDNQNILSNYTLKIQEMAQVPDMYRDDLLKIVTATFEGRYGEGGSKATWQWLQEQNPNLDPALYTRLQQTMEAGRNEFQVAQTRLLDKKRVYKTNLDYVWKGFWLKLAGYPKIDLNQIKIITDATTQQKFETGTDSAVQLRPQAEPAKQ